MWMSWSPSLVCAVTTSVSFKALIVLSNHSEILLNPIQNGLLSLNLKLERLVTISLTFFVTSQFSSCLIWIDASSSNQTPLLSHGEQLWFKFTMASNTLLLSLLALSIQLNETGQHGSVKHMEASEPFKSGHIMFWVENSLWSQIIKQMFICWTLSKSILQS